MFRYRKWFFKFAHRFHDISHWNSKSNGKYWNQIKFRKMYFTLILVKNEETLNEIKELKLKLQSLEKNEIKGNQNIIIY